MNSNYNGNMNYTFELFSGSEIPIFKKLNNLNLKMQKSTNDVIQPNKQQQINIIIKNNAIKFVNKIIDYEVIKLKSKSLFASSLIKFDFNQSKKQFTKYVQTKSIDFYDYLCYNNLNLSKVNHIRVSNDIQAISCVSSKSMHVTTNQQSFYSSSSNINRYTNKTIYSSGMILIFDPRCNTNKSAITLRFTYDKPASTSPTSSPSKNRSNNNTIEIEIWSSIIPYNYSLTSSNDQFANYYDDINLPGWDGVLPVFIPSKECRCEVIVDNNTNINDLNIDVLAINTSNPSTGLRQLSLQYESFISKSYCITKEVGNIPVLNLASLYGDIEIVRELISNNNININTKSSIMNNTPLHDAIYGHNIDIVKVLLNHNADILVQNDSGNTPLHLACSLGYIDIVMLFVNHPLKRKILDIENNKHQKPIDICSSSYIYYKLKHVTELLNSSKKPRIPLMKR